MRLLIATDWWRPAHVGQAGSAWCLGHGLMARGHRVGIILPSGGLESSQAAGVECLSERRPTTAFRKAATERLCHVANAMTSVQRQLLRQTGPITDLTTLRLNEVDAVIGIGVESPHVRDLLGRALGRVSTLIHLGPDDLPLLGVPVLRQALRPHPLVAYWAACARSAAAQLRRDIPVVPLGIVSDGASLNDRQSGGGLDAEEGTRLITACSRPYVVWARVGPGPHDQELDAWARRAGVTVVVAGEYPQGPRSAGLVSLISPRRGRLDRIVSGASAVIASAGDQGDLALVAWLAGAPVVADESSSVVADVQQSDGGWVVGDRASLSDALDQILGPEGRTRAAAGRVFAVQERNWDRILPDYERLISSESLDTGARRRFESAS
jgi:hypothetical protein